MKIVFLTNEYSHDKLPASGGVGTFLKVIARELTAMGHEVTVFGVFKHDISFNDSGVNVIFKKGYFKRYPFAEIARSLASSLKLTYAEKALMAGERKYIASLLKDYVTDNKADIIESHAFNGYAAYWDNSTPLVIRFHGSRGFWHKYLNKKPEPLKMEFEKKSLQSTPHVVAVSRFSAQAINEIYNLGLSPQIIYNGIDVNLFSPKYDVQEIPKSIFYTGTLSDAKGVDVLCNAFNEINRRHPDATLHLVGRGREYYDNKVRKILTAEALNKTTYYGEKQLAEIPPLLQQASLCIYPSLNENFPFAYLEAMAMENVIISSGNRVAGEIIAQGVNGFIATAVEDYANYADKIFTNSSLKQQMAQKARETITINFTKEVMAEKTLDYYNTILQ